MIRALSGLERLVSLCKDNYLAEVGHNNAIVPEKRTLVAPCSEKVTYVRGTRNKA